MNGSNWMQTMESLSLTEIHIPIRQNPSITFHKSEVDRGFFLIVLIVLI